MNKARRLVGRDEVPGPHGRATLWIVKDGLWTPVAETPNTVMVEWGHIAARQIGYKRDISQLDYAIRGMYIEFENTASPGDPVTVPSFSRNDGLEYYDALVSSPDRDFIRAPLRGLPSLEIAAGYEDYFTEGVDGNKLTFFAQSAGAVGVHGKTYSDTVNSTVFGAALLAFPVLDDRTRDVLFARTYFEVSQQTLKQASSQVGVSWDVTFK